MVTPGPCRSDRRAPEAGYQKGAGKKGEGFDGYCHYCNKHGHPKSQCRLLDQEMAAKGGGKKGRTRVRGRASTTPERMTRRAFMRTIS